MIRKFAACEGVCRFGISKDGSSLLSNNGYLWDFETGKIIKEYKALPGLNTGRIVILPGNKKAVIEAFNNYKINLYILDLVSGELKKGFDNNVEIESFDVSPNGRSLLIGYRVSTVKLLSIETEKVIRTFSDLKFYITCVKF